MARYGYNVASFGISTASGSTAIIDLSQYVFTISPINIEAVVTDVHAMGDGFREQAFVGLKQGADITIGGAYNDAASGPHFYLGGVVVGSTRYMRAAVGGAGAFQSQYVLKSYQIMPARGELTMFEAVLGLTGTITTAS